MRAGAWPAGPAIENIKKDMCMSDAKKIGFFEKYLTVWVLLCMTAGWVFGHFFPRLTESLSRMEMVAGSQVNTPIAILIWLMIYPMMLKIDFAALKGVARKPAGLGVTLFVNWLVKPFSMALLGWFFIGHVFAPWLGACRT